MSKWSKLCLALWAVGTCAALGPYLWTTYRYPNAFGEIGAAFLTVLIAWGVVSGVLLLLAWLLRGRGRPRP
jgi:hypothetical protein